MIFEFGQTSHDIALCLRSMNQLLLQTIDASELSGSFHKKIYDSILVCPVKKYRRK